MRPIFTILSLLVATATLGQVKKVAGTYSNSMSVNKLTVTLNSDSTFEYISAIHPTLYDWGNFSEKGRWTMSSDTVILNPQLELKSFKEHTFQERVAKNTDGLLLTFNHIKRQIDSNGNVIKEDTVQIDRLDYAFNSFKRKRITRVGKNATTRCAFAGYIPPEVITTSRTIAIAKPTEKLESIFIGCYELQGIKEFKIDNANANHLTLNVYSNYYQDGQIRQKKFLLGNNKVLYINQKPNGKFVRGNWWGTDVIVKR